MPWKATSIPGYLPSPSVAYSDYYLLEVNVQRISGRWASTGFSLNDTGGDWCNIRGIGITAIELTPEALIITGQDMTYDVTVSQADRATGEMYAYGDIYIEGSGRAGFALPSCRRKPSRWTPSWPLALGIGPGVLAAVGIVLLLWRARRKKRPAPPDSPEPRPGEELSSE